MSSRGSVVGPKRNPNYSGVAGGFIPAFPMKLRNDSGAAGLRMLDFFHPYFIPELLSELTSCVYFLPSRFSASAFVQVTRLPIRRNCLPPARRKRSAGRD